MSDRQRQRLEHRDRQALGADVDPRERPGVPMETAPHPLTPTAPQQVERQRPRHGIVHRKDLRQMTPVFGTAQPLHGVSGLVRRLAYNVRETRARHWMMLIFADRVDVLEHRIARLVKIAALVPVGVAGVVLAARFMRS